MRAPSLPDLCAPLILAAGLAAQQTWIVDAANGVGTRFTDLPPALVAARAGDTILVRAGTYRMGRVDKPLTILGEPFAVVQSLLGYESFEVRGIPAGATLTIQGLRFVTVSGTVNNLPTLSIQACAGRIHLDGVVVASKVTQSMAVDGVRLLTASACDFLPSVFVQNSRFLAQGCAFRAYDFGTGPGTMGLSLYRSHADLAQCTAQGTSNLGLNPTLMALRADQSTVVLRGDAASRYMGGSGSFQAPALDGNFTSDLVIDPSLTLRGPVTGFRSVGTGRLPCLTSRGGQLGRTLTAELYAPAGDLYLLLASLPADLLPVPPLGELALDLRTLLWISSGLQGSTEHTSLTMHVPSDPALHGLPVALQTLSGPLPGLRLGNPSVSMLR